MSHLTMSDSVVESFRNSENKKGNSFFNVPGLFIGLSPKGLSDSDSVRSPTSPLDLRGLSNLGNSFMSPESPHHGKHKGWDTSKVGLSIINSLDNDKNLSGKVLRSESKNILFGPQMRTKTPNSQTDPNSFEAPKSLPKNCAIFSYIHVKSPLQVGNSDVIFGIGETPFEEHEAFGKIWSCSLDSCSSFSALAGFADRGSNVSSGSFASEKIDSLESSPPLMVGGSPSSNNFSHVKLNSMSVSTGSANGLSQSLSASEIELSEDYTRVVSHGPNSRTTHIYEDCILECHTNDLNNICKNEAEGNGVMSSTPQYPSDDFLSLCCSCNKKLEGRDIYIYRGERAFCSTDCRSHEILIDEEMEIEIKSESSPEPDDCEELFETGFFITT